MSDAKSRRRPRCTSSMSQRLIKWAARVTPSRRRYRLNCCAAVARGAARESCWENEALGPPSPTRGPERARRPRCARPAAFAPPGASRGCRRSCTDEARRPPLARRGGGPRRADRPCRSVRRPPPDGAAQSPLDPGVPRRFAPSIAKAAGRSRAPGSSPRRLVAAADAVRAAAERFGGRTPRGERDREMSGAPVREGTTPREATPARPTARRPPRPAGCSRW